MKHVLLSVTVLVALTGCDTRSTNQRAHKIVGSSVVIAESDPTVIKPKVDAPAISTEKPTQSAAKTMPRLIILDDPSPAPQATSAATPRLIILDDASPSPQAKAAAMPAPAKARTAEDYDTTSKAERVQAVAEAKSASGNYLGATITSLGDATEPGIWMKTPLVSKPTKGRVENPASGDAASVYLLPLEGSKSGGSQLSLAAFRLINAPITGLPELKVYTLDM